MLVPSLFGLRVEVHATSRITMTFVPSTTSAHCHSHGASKRIYYIYFSSFSRSLSFLRVRVYFSRVSRAVSSSPLSNILEYEPSKERKRDGTLLLPTIWKYPANHTAWESRNDFRSNFHSHFVRALRYSPNTIPALVAYLVNDSLLRNQSTKIARTSRLRTYRKQFRGFSIFFPCTVFWVNFSSGWS